MSGWGIFFLPCQRKDKNCLRPDFFCEETKPVFSFTFREKGRLKEVTQRSTSS